MTLVTCALSFLFVTYDTSLWEMGRNACFYFSEETMGAELCPPQILALPALWTDDPETGDRTKIVMVRMLERSNASGNYPYLRQAGHRHTHSTGCPCNDTGHTAYKPRKEASGGTSPETL